MLVRSASTRERGQANDGWQRAEGGQRGQGSHSSTFARGRAKIALQLPPSQLQAAQKKGGGGIDGRTPVCKPKNVAPPAAAALDRRAAAASESGVPCSLAPLGNSKLLIAEVSLSPVRDLHAALSLSLSEQRKATRGGAQLEWVQPPFATLHAAPTQLELISLQRGAAQLGSWPRTLIRTSPWPPL